MDFLKKYFRFLEMMLWIITLFTLIDILIKKIFIGFFGI